VRALRGSTVLQETMTRELAFRFAAFACLLAVAGCTTTSLNEAPIVDRSSRPAPSAAAPVPAVPQPPAPREAKDGSYTVQRGDTLYAIALSFGVDARELARWNGIDDPSRLTVGQSLRVTPPASAAAVVPVAPLGAAQTQPLGSGAAAPAAASPAAAAPSAAAPGGAPATPPAAAAAATPPTASTPSPTLPPAAPTATPSAPTAAPPVAAAAAPSAAARPNGAGALGNWSWPVEGKVVETFNETRNKGIDIVGQEGDPVVAVADGQVVYSGSGLRGYGNLVIVKHEDEYISAYAHNRQILVKQGQSVKRGQKIAELGKTDADVPKLHFEIRRQGKPIDPLTVLPKR
jgi:lipoprotein NlpD